MTVKLSSIFMLAALTTAASAQTSSPKPATQHTTSTEAPCATLPEISPKVPALPAGLPCAKPLYTITVGPNVKLDYVSPLEGPDLRQTLGLESTTFSLDYVDIQVGTGELAAPHKWYTIHYTGYMLDGTKFDSSVDRGEPIDVAYGQHQVIPGWDTGFDGMRVGGKRRLFIPYQLAYGNNGKPPIPPKAELIFDVELVAQSDEKPAPKTPPTPPTPAGAAAHAATTPPQPTTSANPNPK